MYSLTLTADERRAFDWVGSRYNSGKVADILGFALTEAVALYALVIAFIILFV